MNEEEEKYSFDRMLGKSLEGVTSLGGWVEFATSYGEGVENVWVTILMVAHGISNEFDSFVWILPVILAILLRPFIVRYVHQIPFRVYRQATMVGYVLLVGAVGCFMVGFSCDLHRKKHVILRLVQATIGWTFMDIAYEISLFFLDKLQTSQKDLLQSQAAPQKLSIWKNWSFWGNILSYCVSIGLCLFIDGGNMRAFYRCAKYAYFSAGGVAMLVALRHIVEVRLSLPHRQQQPLSLPSLSLSSLSVGYFLPGYDELIRSNLRTFSLLSIHFVIQFLNDIVVIYSTIQFAEPSGYDFSNQGAAYLFGVLLGSISLISYTVFNTLNLDKFIPSSSILFPATCLVTAGISLLAFTIYTTYSFFAYSIAVALLSQIYRKILHGPAFEMNPTFERCLQLVERMQKVFVLSCFPIVPLLIFDRDDVSDSLAWSAGICIFGIGMFQSSRMGRPETAEKED